jgi:hypothetical protein
MGNINNFNANKLDLKLSNSDYWDFYLSTDATSLPSLVVTSGDCLVVNFDFNDNNIYSSGTTSADTISSLVYWTGATNTGYTFNTFGLTGLDNGVIPYKKVPNDPKNLALLSALTGTTLVIPSGDSRLHLTRVTGYTGNYIYPINIINNNNKKYAKFCGGFYQGYYKIDGSNYSVLPNRVNKGWVAEFNLRVDTNACNAYTGTTLNDEYPNNKGFFFYLGTRAENKFWDKFDGASTGCTSGCTATGSCTGSVSTWCTVPKESDIKILPNGFTSSTGTTLISLYPDQTVTTEITNPFLIYGRSHPNGICHSCAETYDGLASQTVCSWDGEPIKVTKPKTVVTDKRNPFLVYGRSYSGSSMCWSCGEQMPYNQETACSFSGFSKSIEFDNLDYKLDIIDNALGFRIKDDGSIGYRLLTVTGQCSGDTYVTGVTIEEKYSEAGLIANDLWTSVVIRYSMPDYYDDCQLTYKPKRKGRLMFYINGKLKFVVVDFNELIMNKLNDHMEKQIGVPYNMSLGGGSQGLIETLTFDGIDEKDLNLPIQENFAGTFIGSIFKFRFNICDLDYTNILYNYGLDVNNSI